MPHIYVASLSDYNAGRLHGAWIHVDAGTDPDEVWNEIERVLETSQTAAETGMPAEEWAIHDHEGFDGVKISEHDALEDVLTKARLVDLCGGRVVSELLNGGYCDLSEMEAWIEEHDAGEWESIEDYAEYLLEDALTGLPNSLRYYFDFGAYARDLVLGGDVFTVELDGGKVRVFWDR